MVGGMGLAGTETYLMNIYRNINREKLQFDFLTYEMNEINNHYYEEIENLGGKIHKLRLTNKWSFLNVINDIRKLLKNENYIAVHAHTKYNSGFAVFAAWLEGVKIRIVHSHNTGNEQNKTSIFNDIYRKTMYFVINNYANNFCACSLKAAEQLFTPFNIKNHYRFLPNAVEFDKFLKIEPNEIEGLKDTLKIEGNKKIIGHIGRFVEIKNHEFIINLFVRLLNQDKNLHLVLIGDGPLRLKVEDKIKSLKIQENISVLGLRSDVPEIMNILDVFILPSLFEGLGIVLLEAQAAGLPCIVSENIQPEADMGLGLMHLIHLDNFNQWVSAIIENKGNKIRNKELIKEAIKNSPYILSDVVEKFYNLYGLTNLANKNCT